MKWVTNKSFFKLKELVSVLGKMDVDILLSGVKRAQKCSSINRFEVWVPVDRDHL